MYVVTVCSVHSKTTVHVALVIIYFFFTVFVELLLNLILDL